MKSIAITGSTRGIGYGLAAAFLQRGCQVTVNGRSQTSIDTAIASLSQQYGRERLHGSPGDVTQPATHDALWQAAVDRFGQVDIWINNAGVGHPMLPVWELPPQTIEQVVDVDVKGLIYGSQTAIRGMLAQGHGYLYNMEGFGSNGRTMVGLSVYGATKSAVRFLSQSLVKELAGTPVKIGTLSPGMVITDFILDQYRDDPAALEKAKPVFNALADKVETVTPWLADNVLANDKHGASITWLTPSKIMWRFMTARFHKRDLFS